MSYPLNLAQGSTLTGTEPESSGDIIFAGITFGLREAVYSFPNGCSEEQYTEWVNNMWNMLEAGAARYKTLLAADESVTAAWVPALMSNFGRIYKKWAAVEQRQRNPFDLLDVFVLKKPMKKKEVLLENIAPKFGHPMFRMDTQWMEELVTKWNNDRIDKKDKATVLRLDKTSYIGRLMMDENGQQAMETTKAGKKRARDVLENEPIPCPPKLPLRQTSQHTPPPQQDSSMSTLDTTEKSLPGQLPHPSTSTLPVPSTSTLPAKPTSPLAASQESMLSTNPAAPVP
ncbi:hypothetical protein QCA50_020939 [Cerrena zonata]|uniref:Uncharacterized protein n=1 Tax=Cerrena zonata TaxID=2478898 RepID=A0AAW0FC42_9APHY